jgi:hypothetical protein
MQLKKRYMSTPVGVIMALFFKYGGGKNQPAIACTSF